MGGLLWMVKSRERWTEDPEMEWATDAVTLANRRSRRMFGRQHGEWIWEGCKWSEIFRGAWFYTSVIGGFDTGCQSSE